ncbi:Hypothetical protein R9X50_00317500 [Acrodontium crateriforme]|uniref:RRM domain-containing protein n=1 Tax=Acrodontium crateriforme TaxID=150365 RepID=A0AAQ3M2D1_9PEZI|nr:Hypothetical protein R9X50_00317500 [Acrodontium crateriforme]
MAQAREKGGRVVFIGNIPYGVSEEQICDIFGRVGQVVNFRLVYDKETGKPKGFGFLEYTDVDAAASAVRNLNDHEIGGRQLRVDYSNDNGGGAGNRPDQNDGNRAPPPAHFNMGGQANGAEQRVLPPLPAGTDVPPGLTAPDAISQTIQSIPAPQLLDILSQMKKLVTENPQQANALLTSAPQLSYAIFQALLLLGLVDTTVLGSLIQQTSQAPPPVQPPQPPYARPSMPPQPPYGQPGPTAYGVSPPQQYQQPPQSYATPPVQQSSFQPPPQATPLPTDPQQKALIQQVLAMPMEQIYALEEGPRNQLLTLRAQYGAPTR